MSNQEYFINRSIELLKSAGCRITKPRRLVLELLASATKALQPNDIFLEIKKSEQAIDLASVYRILEVLTELKLIHRESTNGGYFPCTHCAKCPSSIHILVTCNNCGNLEELDYHGEVFGAAFLKKLKSQAINSLQETIYIKNTCAACR